MTQDQAISRVLDLAEAEIGYREVGNNWTKYAEEMDSYAGFYNGPKQNAPWCDVWVDWLFVKSFGVDTGREMLCQPLLSAGAGCLYSAQYYKRTGRWFTSPQPGDQIFFSYSAGEVSHTGIVQKVAGGAVYTIEGNSSDMVTEKVYSTASSFIVGYGRPRWDLAAGIKAEDGGSADADADPAEEAGGAAAEDPGRTFTVTLPEIRQGSTGLFVERVQTLLIARGYYCGGRVYSGRERADGEFGPATLVAVQDLQTANGLEADGIVGGETMRALLLN